MNILFVNVTDAPSGAATVLLKSIQACVDKNKCYLCVPYSRRSPDKRFSTQVKKIQGCSVVTVPVLSAFSVEAKWILICKFFLFPISIIKLYWFVKKHKIDVIYTNTATFFLSVVLAKITGIKHFWHFHEHPYFFNRENGLGQKELQSVKNNINSPNNTTIFLSARQKTLWEESLGVKIQNYKIVYNPLPFTQFVPKTFTSDVKFGFMGAFDTRKNYLFLLSVFEKLHPNYPNTTLLLQGATNQAVIDATYAQTTLQQPELQVALYSPQIEQFYKQVDVFVLPSIDEPWGLVAVEAIAFGCAVICTQNSGLVDILTDGKDVLFIDPQNPDSLYKAMEKCMDATFRENLAKNAQQTLKAFQQKYDFGKAINDVIDNCKV